MTDKVVIVQKYEPVVDYRGVDKGVIPRFVGMRLVSQKVEATMTEGSSK